MQPKRQHQLTDHKEIDAEKKHLAEQEALDLLIREKNAALHGKLQRLEKVAASIIEAIPEDIAIAHLVAWSLIVVCDLMRLFLQLWYRHRCGDNPTHKKTHYFGGNKAIRFRAAKFTLSTLRLITHALTTTIGQAIPATAFIFKALLLIFRGLSSSWTITDDTCKFFHTTKESFAPLTLFHKKTLSPGEKQEVGFYSGKVLFFFVSVAAIAVSAAAGPAAPAVLGAIAIALSITGVVGYSSCSITKAIMGLTAAKKKKTRLPTSVFNRARSTSSKRIREACLDEEPCLVRARTNDGGLVAAGL